MTSFIAGDVTSSARPVCNTLFDSSGAGYSFAVEPWLPCKFNPPAAVRYVYGPMNVCVISFVFMCHAAIGIFRCSCGTRTRDPAVSYVLIQALPTELRSRVCVQASKLRDTVFFVRLYAVGRMKASTMEIPQVFVVQCIVLC